MTTINENAVRQFEAQYMTEAPPMAELIALAQAESMSRIAAAVERLAADRRQEFDNEIRSIRDRLVMLESGDGGGSPLGAPAQGDGAAPAVAARMDDLEQWQANLDERLRVITRRASEQESLLRHVMEIVGAPRRRRNPMQQVFDAIRRERAHQDAKWGTITANHHSVGAWLLIAQEELSEAKRAWVHEHGDADALRELLQVITVGVACLEQHGIVERAPVQPPAEEPPA